MELLNVQNIRIKNKKGKKGTSPNPEGGKNGSIICNKQSSKSKYIC